MPYNHPLRPSGNFLSFLACIINYIFQIYDIMAFAKTESFPIEIQEMAAFASALSHPARIAMITYLHQHPGCRCSELVAATPLSQPSCSRHLGELRRAGLVVAHPVGSEIRYELNPERIESFCSRVKGTLQPE